MRWWKYKPLFEFNWKEPAEFSQHRNSKENKKISSWKKPISVFGFVASLIFLNFLFSGQFTSNTPVSIPIFALAGLIVVYGSYWLRSFVPSTVAIDSRQVIASSWVGTKYFHFGDIENINFSCIKSNGSDFKVMSIFTKDGILYTAAIPEKVSVEKVKSYLIQQGLDIRKEA